jgi:hypothetical protein
MHLKDQPGILKHLIAIRVKASLVVCPKLYSESFLKNSNGDFLDLSFRKSDKNFLIFRKFYIFASI